MRCESASDLGLDQHVGDGEARLRQILQGTVVGRVQRGHAEQPARCDSRNADDHAAVIVELEVGADPGVLELVELRILDGDEGVLAVDVLDLPSSSMGRPNRLVSSRPMTLAA